MNRADEDDFRSFVAARSPSLLWFAHLLTGDRHAAEDIVQTALAKTAAGWSRVRRKENPEGYVRRAIVNTHINAMRRRPWREQPREHLPEDIDSRRREHELDDRDAMWHALAGIAATAARGLGAALLRRPIRVRHRRRARLQSRHRQKPGRQRAPTPEADRAEGGRVNMTDVEQLLRETLADPRHRLDPGPGMYDTVRERAHQRRRRVVQVASAFTAVVVIAGVATAIGVNSGHRRGDQVAAPSITPSPQTGQATSVDLGKGSTSAMAVTSSGVFVARQQPNELLQVSATNLSITKRVATPDAVDDIAVDAAAGRVWTWSTEPSVRRRLRASVDRHRFDEHPRATPLQASRLTVPSRFRPTLRRCRTGRTAVARDRSTASMS